MEQAQTLELSVDADLVSRLDEWIARTASANSHPEAIRQLVDIGLSMSTDRTIRLTDGDKLNFMMLRDIMKALKIKDGETNAELVSASITGGHYWAPKQDMPGLFHDHVDQPADVALVANTLDAWDFIEEAIDHLSEADLEKLKATNHGHVPKFSGFDGNNEPSLMSITRFFVETMNRWPRFQGRDFNSHSPTAERSRRLVAAFEPMRADLDFGRRLGVDQIIELVRRA